MLRKVFEMTYVKQRNKGHYLIPTGLYGGERSLACGASSLQFLNNGL